MSAERPRITYRTATSLDGFIADEANSLRWLFALEEDDDQESDYQLGAGAPLLPRRIDSTRLRLLDVAARGQFVAATYAVTPSAE